jgi:hypothetical protein
MHFTSSKPLKFWYGNQKWERVFFLCDYELLGERQTGMDVIEELGVGEQAILVTSHFEETELRKRCERLGVKLLPKGLAGIVPIDIVESPRALPLDVQEDHVRSHP